MRELLQKNFEITCSSFSFDLQIVKLRPKVWEIYPKSSALVADLRPLHDISDYTGDSSKKKFLCFLKKYIIFILDSKNSLSGRNV